MAPSRVNIYFQNFCGRLRESEVLRLCGFCFAGNVERLKGKYPCKTLIAILAECFFGKRRREKQYLAGKIADFDFFEG